MRAMRSCKISGTLNRSNGLANLQGSAGLSACYGTSTVRPAIARLFNQPVFAQRSPE